MTSKQRAYLRSLASKIDAIFQIGKNGLNENLIKQLDDALEARELIKITVLENSPDTVREAAEEIAGKIKAEVVQVMGNKITLFRQKKKDSRIELPE